MLGLIKENSDTLGFVFDCLFSGVINKKEVNLWAEKVIGENEVKDLPDYIFDLIDYNGTAIYLSKLVGFDPIWKHTKSQDMALYGIRLKRGKSLRKDDVSFNAEQALKALEKHPEIEKLFRETFPFIDF